MSSGPQVRALVCPNCGGAVTLSGYAQTVNAVCQHCLTILDTRTPSLAVLQNFGARERYQPLIPLGQRGTIRKMPVENIGFQVRAIVVEGTVYRWTEYLLFHPYRGYRYLTEYEGHWNYIQTIPALPEVFGGSKPKVRYQNRTYTHFQRAIARAVYVMGEFPWQVRVGDAVEVNDYINPPYVLSSEGTPLETTWSQGEYIQGKEIWQAFRLPGAPPAHSGVYANQPSPYTGAVFSIWRVFAALLLIVFGLAFSVAYLHRNEVAFQERFLLEPDRRPESAFVTNPFELRGHESNVEIELHTNLSNNWAYFNLALIDNQSGSVWESGKEISYYFGRDSDGSWTEGGRSGSITIPDVPAGTYYLRVETEMDRTFTPQSINYDIQVKRDVPTYWPFFVAAILLVIPPVFTTFRRFSFEHQRWQESDYGSPYSSSSDE